LDNAIILFDVTFDDDITPWADRVQSIDADYDGVWELPVLGAVTAPTAVLIRPDGYVAWVGDVPQPGLADAPESFPSRLNRNGGSVSYFDAFSSREPVSTSLENALTTWFGPPAAA
jgi:hypothetical protein